MEEIEINDSTILLIHRLTKAEKSFITKQIGKTKSYKNHYALLKIIAKNNAAIEPEIKATFEKETKSKFFTVVKSQLQEVILEHLSDFYSKKNIERQLLEKIFQAEILIRKSIKKQASKILHSVIKDATKHELGYINIKALDLLLSISLRFKPSNKITEYITQQKEEVNKHNQYLQVITERINLNELSFEEKQIDVKQQKYLQTKAALDKIDPEILTTVKAKMLYFYTKGLLELLYKNDIKQASVFNELSVLQIEKHPYLLNLNLEIYLSSLHNLASCYDMLDNKKAFDKTLHKILNAKSNDEHDQTKIVERYILNTQTYLIYRNRHKELKIFIEENESLIKKHLTLMPPTLLISILINNTICYFVLEEYKRAAKWNNLILNNSFFVLHHAQSLSRMYNLIIHYELKNIDLLESFVPRTTRFLVTHNYYTGIFKLITVFFQNHINSGEDLIPKKTFLALKEDIARLPISDDFNETEFRGIILEWIHKKTS